MQQEREENKIIDEKKEESGSDSDPLEKSDSDEKDDSNMLSSSLPSMGYGYVNSINNGDEKDSSNKYYSRESDKGCSRLTSQKAASPLVIQWLQENYEAADGTSLPRSTLYTHYVGFCNSMSLEPVNAASFGKLIRSIFPNLKTRRLGTRGHSKYHYYGIQIKATSDLRLPAYQINESSIGVNKQKNRLKKEYEGVQPAEKMSPQNIPNFDIPATITQGATHVQLPDFILPEGFSLPLDVSIDHVHSFMNAYKKHNQLLVDHVYKQQFSEVEKILRHFWQTLPQPFRTVVGTPELVEQIGKKDQITYRAMAHVLLPNVLQSLPVSIPQAIRHFSKQLEPWLASALEGLPPNLMMKKLFVAKKFAQSLHKQASLNHLTQAARAVLQNTSQVSQMIVDWNRLDFEFIKSQASWVCGCGDDIILSAQEDFKKFLTDRVSLEQWASWLHDFVSRILGKSNDARDLVYYSQQLLLKWSFYSTLIIRDLTIRNATSFGSFHLLRTLFDEYIFYLVESKLASVSPQPTMQQEAMAFSQFMDRDPHIPSSSGSVDSFSLDNLLNKENPRLSSKHLPFPFQDTNHERMGVPSEDDFRMEMLQHENLLHLQQQQQYSTGMVPRMNSTFFPKTMNEIRMMGPTFEQMGSLKRPLGSGDPVLKPPGMIYGYQIPESIRSQLSSSSSPHPLESLITNQQNFRNQEGGQDSNKKVRVDNGQTTEVK